MKRIQFFWVSSFFALVMLTSSCIRDQNFENLEDLSVFPTVTVPLLALESIENGFNEAEKSEVLTQEFTWDEFLMEKERLLSGVVSYQIDNTTSKELNVVVAFLDSTGYDLDTESFLLPAGPTGILQREVTYGTASGKNIDILRNTASINIRIQNLGDSHSSSVLLDPKVSVVSSGKFSLSEE
ncbi:hypothetical protein U1E44_07365 [Arenibacter sp. GZD96]|uniref:hypothetical protein n=1 Tax=Aurantibrevibacter litoralis TaxID=3106030 RepID=UPI002AFDCDD0|nr:hypothetical protein [Arenibacter sp. GZD-96]MEA1785905.1 hypothetical protein [Arenibacter sp. GZD-96]